MQKDASFTDNANTEVRKAVNQLWTKCCNAGVLQDACPLYDFFSNNDCASEDDFFTKFQE